MPKRREQDAYSNQMWGIVTLFLKLNRDKQINYLKIWGKKGFRIWKGEGTKGSRKFQTVVWT